MKKTAKKRTARQAKVAPPPEPHTIALSGFLQQSLHTFFIQEGMKALNLLLEGDRASLCGPAHSKGAKGSPQRWGYSHGALTFGGQRIVVDKPRVRHNGQELELPSWAAFSDDDPLNARVLEQMTIGVSTRKYQRSIDKLPESMGAFATSKSAVSRRFVAMTQQRLKDWLARDLSDLRLAALMLDGIVVAGRSVIIALGIDEEGRKQVLGLYLGNTENAAVVGGLLDQLIERGLDPLAAYLFVIDGSKALRKAIKVRFGELALVQRCQVHKRRNILTQLPKTLQASVKKTLSEAFASVSAKTAKKRLIALAGQLQADHPDAAASLREGLNEMFTVKALGLSRSLEKTLSTTNAIENLNGQVRAFTRRVKNWRNGSMIQRWVGAALVETERGFHRLKGHRSMPVLVAALKAKTNHIDKKKDAA